MPFYYLHNKEIEPKSIKDFKYLYYIGRDLKRSPSISFIDEPNVKYCVHKMRGGFIQWSPDDENIDILGHEGRVEATFKKIANHKKFEVWVNNCYEK